MKNVCIAGHAAGPRDSPPAKPQHRLRGITAVACNRPGRPPGIPRARRAAGRAPEA